MRVIPNPYVAKLDAFVLKVTMAIQGIRPFLSELGNTIELEGDDFTMTIVLHEHKDEK